MEANMAVLSKWREYQTMKLQVKIPIVTLLNALKGAMTN